MSRTVHSIALIVLLFAGVSVAGEQTATGLRAAIDGYLAAEWTDCPVDWIELSMPDAKLMDAGDHWTLDGPELPRGKTVLYVNVMDGDTRLRRVPFRIRVMPFAWTPVVDRRLSRGDVITAEALRWERREVTEIRHPWPESPDAFTEARLRARRSMNPGDVLTWPDVEVEPEVCRGDQVNLLLQRGAVTLETEGVALQDGRTGETIRVEQQELGSLLKVRVVGPKRAEIIRALGR
ncbi:flagellar basal body P-ring formation chaperone FlgA [bacterium]|nr:flagellar basal body P-ring formation chaperone FlgA [bacterium]